MLIYSNGQGITLLYLLFCGVIIGFTYELLYILRKLCRDNYIICIVCDLVFLAVAGFLFLYFTYITTLCEIRIYTVFAVGLGFLSENISIHDKLAKVLSIVYNGKKKKE